MEIKKVFDEFIDTLLDVISEEYRQTSEYLLVKEKINKVQLVCESEFTKEQQALIEEYLELLTGLLEDKMSYSFKKALLINLSALPNTQCSRSLL
ncbi:MAG: hypothetical protein FWG90_13145 [Oscillospiraceae bacterium]|nr:hypothetical protein [Oscillospiraceae bacterium]